MIPIDLPRLNKLIDNMGGPAKLMDKWGEKFETIPDRDTFADWRKLPKFRSNLTSYLRLCACLDVDPIVLIPNEYFLGASFGDLMLMLALRPGPGRGIKVQDVFETFGPLVKWPAARGILESYKRDWVRQEFRNQGQTSSRFQIVQISIDPTDLPRAVHFSYRVKSADRWRMYGSVFVNGAHVSLIHLYGPHKDEISKQPGSFEVQTRFGEDPCDFCLASLHEFRIKILGVGDGKTGLRFSS